MHFFHKLNIKKERKPLWCTICGSSSSTGTAWHKQHQGHWFDSQGTPVLIKKKKNNTIKSIRQINKMYILNQPYEVWHLDTDFFPAILYYHCKLWKSEHDNEMYINKY